MLPPRKLMRCKAGLTDFLYRFLLCYRSHSFKSFTFRIRAPSSFPTSFIRSIGLGNTCLMSDGSRIARVSIKCYLSFSKSVFLGHSVLIQLSSLVSSFLSLANNFLNLSRMGFSSPFMALVILT